MVKNLFVLLPAPFAAAAGHSIDPVELALGFIFFSLVPAGIYAWNDVFDAERDRSHPRKKFRPVASGEITSRTAIAVGVILVAVGVGGLFVVGGGRSGSLAAAYVSVTLFYSVRGKHIPFVDVALLTLGFLIRILVGCRLIDAVPSNWLLICGSTVALFLALGKRRSDLALGIGTEHRPSLARYSLRGLDRAMAVTLVGALVAYTLYTRKSAIFLPGREIAGVPFVALGLFLYLRRTRREGETRSPVDIVLYSPEIPLTLLGYALATAWGLGAGP